MSYTVTRRAIYLPERSNIDLNATLIAPNLAVLVSFISSKVAFLSFICSLLCKLYVAVLYWNII